MTTFCPHNEDCVQGMTKLPAASSISSSLRPLTIWAFVTQNSPIEPIAPAICIGAKRGPRKSRASSKPTAHFFSMSAHLPPIRCFHTRSCWSCVTYSSLQNTIHWIKSISIEEKNGKIVSRGHFKPISSRRFLNDCHEYVFHFTKSGRVEIDRLALGVPYQDKSNIARWSHTSGRDRRCRGNTWFIPYETIQSRAKGAAAPGDVPGRAGGVVHQATRRFARRTPCSIHFWASEIRLSRRRNCGVEKFIGFEIDETYLAEAKRRIGAQASLPAGQAGVSPAG